MFLSATLLFSIQPMLGKMVLPLFGGASSVWNVCIVFFQSLLLAGYAYAHLTSTRLARSRHLALHAAIVLLPLFLLPIAVNKYGLPANDNLPLGQLLALLCLSAAIPFFVVSTTAPLLQRWFAWSNHPSARDPYFLYGASNCGSLLALLAYPYLIEPNLPLVSQSRYWTAGYMLFLALMAVCAGLTFWLPTAAPQAVPQKVASHLTVRQRAHWVALALVPSSLLLGATSYITTDLVAIPVLWIIPLALYLVSFIVAFSWFPGWLQRTSLLLMPPIVLVVVFLMVCGITAPWWELWMTIALHLALLFVVSLVCHGELANSRPPSDHITEFYLWVSLGGVLGGLCNTLLAPLLFDTVGEYPLTIIGGCLLLPSHNGQSTRWTRWLDLGLPLLLGALAVGPISGLLILNWNGEQLAHILGIEPAMLSKLGERIFRVDADRLPIYFRYAPAVVLCYLFAARPIRFGLGVGVLLLVAAYCANLDDRVIHQERSFYGVLKVERRGSVHRLVHGTTLHGVQSREPAQRFQPLTYYHRIGPIGQVIASLDSKPARSRFAVIGLGTGSMASYGGPERDVTFFEIDPAVLRIAGNPDYFTYLEDCAERGGRCDVVLGDARRKLAESHDSEFDLIVVDAFSSDSIPIHLITLEGVEMYLAKLSPRGLLAFHISNRHVDLEPVLANIAAKAGLVIRAQHDGDDYAVGKSASDWVILAESSAHLGALADDARWREPVLRPEIGVWTDDFSDVLKVFHWR